MASEKEGVEVSAKTIEEAIERGLGELGLPREQVEVEVIHSGRSGVLGFGAEDARVRIVPRPVMSAVEVAPAQVDERVEPPASAGEPASTPGEVDGDFRGSSRIGRKNPILATYPRNVSPRATCFRGGELLQTCYRNGVDSVRPIRYLVYTKTEEKDVQKP